MKRSAVFYGLMLLVILGVWALERNLTGLSVPGITAQNVQQCFMNATGGDNRSSESLAYERRQTYGFEKETSLTEAVRLFNEEQKCHSQAADPLTEDEVVASILAGSDYGSRDVIDHQYDDLLKIATQKRMPKGSLFVFEGDSSSNGAFIEGDIFIKGQRLYLFLDLDSNPRRSAPLERSQVYLIRKRFVSSQTVKLDRTLRAN